MQIHYVSKYLSHHGIMGQSWGVRNGPPYPLSKSQQKKAYKKVRKAVKKKNIDSIINIDKRFAQASDNIRSSVKELNSIADKFHKDLDKYYRTEEPQRKINKYLKDNDFDLSTTTEDDKRYIFDNLVDAREISIPKDIRKIIDKGISLGNSISKNIDKYVNDVLGDYSKKDVTAWLDAEYFVKKAIADSAGKNVDTYWIH